MFTGIVEAVGTITEVSHEGAGTRLTVGAPFAGNGLALGDSVSVNGVCLTVTDVGDRWFAVDAVPETLARTNLGELDEGSEVNLERAMPADGRFDGHVVQGHVDGRGRVRAVQPEGHGRRITIDAPRELMRYVVHKGSVTVDGVSLTVAHLVDDGFEIALIPHTLDVTTLGGMVPGKLVNLEVDILAKYVERILETRA